MVVRVNEKFQRTLVAQMAPLPSSFKAHMLNRFRKWDADNPRILYDKFMADFSAPSTEPPSARYAAFRIWFNGWFTAKRMEQREKPCWFCGHLSVQSILPNMAAQRPGDKPIDSMQHIQYCWVLNRIAFELGFTAHPGSSWWDEYIKGRLRRTSSEGLQHNEYIKWAGATYDLHNSLRHGGMRSPPFLEMKRAVTKSLEELGGGGRRPQGQRGRGGRIGRRAGGGPQGL